MVAGLPGGDLAGDVGAAVVLFGCMEVMGPALCRVRDYAA
jgi:hypothetical protein